MNHEKYDWFGFMLLGISLGIFLSTFYFYGFIEDRADDNTPMLINNELYILTKYDLPPSLLYITNNFTPIINQSNINHTWWLPWNTIYTLI